MSQILNLLRPPPSDPPPPSPRSASPRLIGSCRSRGLLSASPAARSLSPGPCRVWGWERAVHWEPTGGHLKPPLWK